MLKDSSGMYSVQKGFTLIELVIVIVILGILSAFALPRFADLSGEAETATIQGAQGSAESATQIVRSKALAAGLGNSSSEGAFTFEGTPIDLANGYLAKTSLEDAAQLEDFQVNDGSSPASVTVVDPETDSPCFNFTESTGSDDPSEVSDLGTWDGSSCSVTP